MDVTPGTPEKRTRAKAKDPAAQVAKPKAAAKKPRGTARKAASQPTAAVEATTVITPTPSPEELNGMIATAAYYLAEERNFTPGHELDDWLEAERRIRATLFG